MDLQTIVKLDQENYMNTFGPRTPVCLTHGEGVKVYDTEGKCYLDFFAGIAVNALGHSHPALVKAVSEQAGKLMHCSNLYYNEPQTKLAAKINALAGGGHRDYSEADYSCRYLLCLINFKIFLMFLDIVLQLDLKPYKIISSRFRILTEILCH